MSRQLKADIALLLITVGWGASFILTKDSLSELATYNFLAIRFIIAFAMSAAFFHKRMMNMDNKTLKLGLAVGAILYLTYAFQTVGLNYTSASKSAFITALSVIMVPIISALILKNMPDRRSVAGAALAFVGMGFLTLNKASAVNIGDFYTFLCAVLFAVYILAVGKFTRDVDSIAFAVVQLGVVGALSLVTSLVVEAPVMPESQGVWVNIIILSVVCTSGAYIVQNVAQKYTSSTHTALIYTAEPVFAAMFGYLMFGEVLSPKGIFGAVLIVMGMLLAEIDFKVIFGKNEFPKDEIIQKLAVDE